MTFPTPFDRRTFLRLSGLAAAANFVGWSFESGSAAAQSTLHEPFKPTIRPRSDWALSPESAEHRAPTGPIPEEPDVRFLLVHHTASTNDYEPNEVASQIQGFFDFHTGPEKAWPDVAYNFFIDRFGDIWEGRTGSIERAVAADATGGSQGFAQLCCLVGNYSDEDFTPAQRASLVSLLAWLSVRFGIDPTPGATTTFESRGSNLWPAGQTVVARTISGHRDMSLTACPGDIVYGHLDHDLPAEVTQTVASLQTTATPTSTTAATPTTAGPLSTATTAEAAQTTAAPAPSPPASALTSEQAANPGTTGTDDGGSAITMVVGTLAAAGAAVGAAILVIGRMTGLAGRDSSDRP